MRRAPILRLAQRLLPHEKDQSLTQSVLSHAATALRRYLRPEPRSEFVPGFESMAAHRMVRGPDLDQRITWFRALRAFAETPEGLAKLEAILSGQLSVPGVELRPLDRWSLVTAFDRAWSSSLAGDPYR